MTLNYKLAASREPIPGRKGQEMRTVEAITQDLRQAMGFPFDLCGELAAATGSMDLWESSSPDDDAAEIIEAMLQRVGREYAEIER